MERNPYYSIEAEEAIIGALFLEGELIKDCTLRPEHFYSSQLRKIYMLMGQLAKKENQLMLYRWRRKQDQMAFLQSEEGLFALSS